METVNFNLFRPLEREEYSGFYYSVISLVQDLIDSFILKNHYKNDSKINILKKISMIPAFCMEKPKYFIIYSYAIPIMFTVVQIPALAYILFYLSNENRQQIFKYMELIKISSTKYILQNRLIDFILNILPFIPVFIIFKITETLIYTNYIIIFIYMIVLLISSNSFYMLSAGLFKNESIGMVVGFIILLIGALISVRIKMDIFIPATLAHRLLVIYFKNRIL